MQFTQQSDKQFFSLTDLTFSDVKTVRDALKLHAKNGSAQAIKIAKEIEDSLAKMDI